MEILKKIGIVLIFTFLTFHLSAQDEIINAFKESYSLEKKGEYLKAVEKLKAVYQDDSYEINLRIGWLNYLGGQLNESISFYNKAITLKPYAIEAKLGLAYPVAALGKWDEIIALYTKILEIDPQNSTANYRMGLIYYGRENYEKTDQYIEKVINLYPFDYDSIILLAWSKLKQQKYREAKVLFNKALLYNPGDESATEGLSQIK